MNYFSFFVSSFYDFIKEYIRVLTRRKILSNYLSHFYFLVVSI